VLNRLKKAFLADRKNQKNQQIEPIDFDCFSCLICLKKAVFLAVKIQSKYS